MMRLIPPPPNQRRSQRPQTTSKWHGCGSSGVRPWRPAGDPPRVPHPAHRSHRPRPGPRRPCTQPRRCGSHVAATTSLPHRRGYRRRPGGTGTHHAYHAHHRQHRTTTRPAPQALTLREPHPIHIVPVRGCRNQGQSGTSEAQVTAETPGAVPGERSPHQSRNSCHLVGWNVAGGTRVPKERSRWHTQPARRTRCGRSRPGSGADAAARSGLRQPGVRPSACPRSGAPACQREGRGFGRSVSRSCQKTSFESNVSKHDFRRIRRTRLRGGP